MHHFFAYLSRLRYIRRWSLQRNVTSENVMEHSCEVAMIAHALAVIGNTRYGAALSPDRAAALAVFHECSEVITGDLATPVKYFSSKIRDAYQEIEHVANDKLLGMLPQDLKPAYEPMLKAPHEEPEWPYVKAADTICAYLKCLQEQKSGNGEFDKAALNIRQKLDRIKIPAVEDFMREFAPGYRLTLDELN